MQKMKMPIITSVIVIALIAAGLGMGTMAYFTDDENAAITITAGTVDLQLSKTNSGGWAQGLSFAFPTGFAPGDVYQVDVYLRNMGTTGMRALHVYGDNLIDSDAPWLSHKIDITKVGFYDVSGMVEPGTDGTYYETGAVGGYNIFGDATGPLTLNEFCTSRIPGTSWGYMRFFWGNSVDEIDYLPVGGAVRLVELEFTFNTSAGDEYQGDVTTFDIVFLATDDMGYDVIWENTG